jgi:hypothetical protein
MSHRCHRGLWLEGVTPWPDFGSRALGVCFFAAWLLLIAARSGQPPPTSRPGCTTDPWDFLSIGETVELSTLVFLVEAHCTKPKYSSDGWIELSHGGGRVDVELRRIDIAGATYIQVVSIGGATS